MLNWAAALSRGWPGDDAARSPAQSTASQSAEIHSSFRRCTRSQACKDRKERHCLSRECGGAHSGNAVS